MTTKLNLTLHSLYPRSEALVQASRSLDRKRLSASKFEQVLNQDQEDLCRLQQKLGCSFLESGCLNWPDRFRPLIISCQGLTPGPLTRFADTNTFYKPPIVNEPLKLNGKKLLAWFPRPPGDNWKVTLPSPWHLAVASGSADPNRLALFSQLLLEAAELLVNQGVSFIQFGDPVLAEQKPTPAETKQLRAFFQKLSDLSPNLTTGYFVELADFNQVAGLVLSLPVNYYGFDLFVTPITDLPDSLGGKALLVGAVDARNSLVEKPRSIVRAISLLEEKLYPSSVLLSPSTALEFVPENIARQKIAALAEAIKVYRQGGQK